MQDADAAPPAPLPAPEEAPAAPPLPVDVLRRVLSHQANDVATLCAAACVAKDWRDAAADPTLWRCPEFSTQATLNNLTDARLSALAARAPGQLERLDLTQCTAITARGVMAALRGQSLASLCVRGVRSNEEGDDDVVELLHALVRSPDGLDVSAHILCDATRADADGAQCTRLCGDADELCQECRIFYCAACTVAAMGVSPPPCEHLCLQCWQADEDGYELIDCDNCGAPATEGEGADVRHNGYCNECVTMCHKCDRFFCEECAYTLGWMYYCTACDRVTCEHCIGTRVMDQPVRCCGACCHTSFCSDCAWYENEHLSWCDGAERCNNCFCQGCAGRNLRLVDGADEAKMLCKTCRGEA